MNFKCSYWGESQAVSNVQGMSTAKKFHVLDVKSNDQYEAHTPETTRTATGLTDNAPFHDVVRKLSVLCKWMSSNQVQTVCTLSSPRCLTNVTV